MEAIIGYWVGTTDIPVVSIDGELYALDGWNGEKWLHCWKCIDRYTAADDDREYEIIPHYDWEDYDEDADVMDDDTLTGYEVL